MQSVDTAGFPADICLTDPKYSKLRRWIELRYGHYSETTVWRNTIKFFPEEFEISDYGKETWNTKAMRAQISEIVDEQESQAVISDDCAVMPGHVCSYLHMRICSYWAKKRFSRLHNGLKGSKMSSVSSYMILEGQSRRGVGHKKEIFEVWRDLIAKDQWQFVSVGEHWRYGRLFVKTAKRFLRAEIWYDVRPWSPRRRLARFGEMMSDLYEGIE